MPQTTTTREWFAKTDFTRENVEAEAARRRNDPGVVSATVEENGDNWVLVTEREVL